ncbi:hypothetical protein SAMN05660209_04623 [Geodermatophilus africanus]|uniref:Uncharacterized protein n=1 Tax=Geodermatophilus africanus TaxID=1137993 RepID=A0A1H3Q5K7_9ACTN|nr:hypothetical protein SAMN05660209_04623 [Geodermatophilus africanus]
MVGGRTLAVVIGFGRARGAARREWRRFETPEYAAAVSLEVRLRQEHGDRRAARSVAFEALEQVRRRSGSPQLTTLAYRRTLRISSDALRDRRAQGVGPQRHDGSRPWGPGR